MPTTADATGEAEGTDRSGAPRLGSPANASGIDGRGRKEDEMPQQSWTAKRERPYEHVKEGLQQRGRNPELAKEIAARTVNKERARAGEAREISRSSVEDISSGRRGGLRSHRGPGGRTVAQLRNEARERGLRGYSRMRKRQLERALSR